MRRFVLTPAQLEGTFAPKDPRPFDAGGHVIGCSEWADRWERHWGRANLDSSTIRNLDEHRRRGRGPCCRATTPAP